MKRFFLFPLPLLLLTSCLFSPKLDDPLPVSPTDRSVYKDGLVQQYQSVLDGLPYSSFYNITFTIADDMQHIAGRETVVYTNAEEVPLNEVKFRLFGNILGGEMHVSEVLVAGKPIIPNYSLDDSLLTVPLSTPLQPKGIVILEMDFNLKVSDTIRESDGVQAYYNNVLALAHAYPMIAVYDDEGWKAEIPPDYRDATYADMSFFLVTVDAPKNVVLVGSGRETSRQKNGNRQKVQYEAGPARDFYLAASKEYQVVTKKVNGVAINFYTREMLKDGAENALEYAAASLEVFGKRYAPYPYTELDFVTTPTSALGFEYPGMIVIAEGLVTPHDPLLEFVIVHETGHQWFYNLVGNDRLDDPWLYESLTQWATMQYLSDTHNAEEYEIVRKRMGFVPGSFGKDPIPVGLPAREYSSTLYERIVDERGPLFFEALRDKIGVEAFDAFLKDYVESSAWNIATPQGLRSKAEEHCSCDLTSLFNEWIYP